MKIYRRFLASYLCVCLVPLLLSLVTIGRLEYRVQDSIVKNQEGFMQSARQEIDQNLGNAASLVSIFSENAPTPRLAEKQSLTVDELFELCELTEALSTVIGQNAGFYRGFCYFARSGFLATDRRTYHPQATDLFSWDLQLDPENFYSVLDGGSNAEHITTVYKKEKEGWIMVLRSQYDQHTKEFLSCVGIVMRVDQTLSPWNTADSEAFVTNDAYRLISGGALACQACEFMEKTKANQGELDLNGQRYVYSQYQSSLSGIRYGFLTRREAYYQELRIIWFQLIAEIAVIFAVSVLLAVFWSKRTYRPIKGILPFVEQEQPQPGYRSIAELGSVLVNFAQEKASLENQVEQSAQQARCSQYLLGLREDSSALSQYLEEGQPYQLLAFAPARPAANHEALFQELRNRLDDLLLVKNGGVSLQLHRCAAVLVQKSLSYEEAVQIHYAMERTLSLSLVCYMSDTYTHLEDAPQAWAAVSRALRQDSFWEQERERGVWVAASLPEMGNSAPYREFLSRQKTLTECLTAGKRQRAENCLRKILSEDLSDRDLPAETVRRRYADIAEILLPYAAEEGGRVLRQFQRYETAQEMEEALLSLFAEISQDAEPGLPQIKKELTEKVREYVRANYQDPALNASMIAGYLGMNLSTLSHQYKAATGSGILDELHAVRLEAAKKLLAQGISVRETAERTGYVDPRALIRAFKRYEGITPGQYAKSGAPPS